MDTFPAEALNLVASFLPSASKNGLLTAADQTKAASDDLSAAPVERTTSKTVSFGNVVNSYANV